MMAIQNEELEIMQLLLEKGAAVNTQNAQGLSPLMIALSINFLEGVSLLLKFKPESQLELQGVSGETALIMASKYGNLELVSMFLTHGADVWAQTFQGFTSKFVANRFGHLAVEDMLTAWERKNPQMIAPKLDNIDANLSIEQYLESINLTHLTDFFIENLFMVTLEDFKCLRQKKRDKIERTLASSDLSTLNASLEAMGICIQKFSLIPTGQETDCSTKGKGNDASVKDAPA